MAHINPHKEPRRAKMLDLANKSVKGSLGGNRSRRSVRRTTKQLYQQWERRSADRTYRHLRDFRCSGEAECDCPGCSCELGNTPEARKWAFWAYPHFENRDDLAGAFRSAEKWALRLGSSDALLSWLKQNYPDTLAGRHAIDHIMESFRYGGYGMVQCKCDVDFGGKGNHGQCTCKAFLPKNRHLSGQYRRRRRGRGRRLGSR